MNETKKIRVSWSSLIRRYMMVGLLCFAFMLSQAAEGTNSNGISEDTSATTRGDQNQAASKSNKRPSNTRDNGNSNRKRLINSELREVIGDRSVKVSSIPKRQPGAPSRYLEYEPDATYLVRMGTHPTISYPNLEDFSDTEIRIRYDSKSGGSSSISNKDGVFEIDDCPRHFLWLSDRAIQKELDHRLQTGTWSERVLVEKFYFTLFYGGTGLASQYMDSVDDFQTDLKGWEVMNRSSNHCDWEGIECSIIESENGGTAHGSNDNGKELGKLNSTHVVGFQINGFSLEGTLPHDLYHLSYLKNLDLQGNRILGEIPDSWGNFGKLTHLDLEDNRLSGELPTTLEHLTNIQTILLSRNRLEGTISESLLEAWAKNDNSSGGSKTNETLSGLKSLDLSKNKFEGPFPMETLLRYASDLEKLDLSNNMFTGDLPDKSSDTMVVTNDNCEFPSDGESIHENDESSTSMPPEECLRTANEDGGNSHKPSCSSNYAGLESLENLNLSHNRFHGKIPRNLLELPSLRIMVLSNNQLSGSLPTEVWRATSLVQLELSQNKLAGHIPSGGEQGWPDLVNLEKLYLDHNQLRGTVPYELPKGLGDTLKELDLGNNHLEGSLPSSLGKMTALESLDVHGNRLTGSLPAEMNRMFPDVQLNLTENLLTGTVPKLFCGGGAMSSNLIFRQFGCDAILCPAGTFHPDGAASLYSGCRPCPIKQGDDPLSAKTLGQRKCGNDNNRTTFVHGDLNGDGILSEREVLRLLYTYTVGKNWGLQFENWADTTIEKCDLNGVTCLDGNVAKIDLTDATMCANTERKAAAPSHECKGIPAEISKLKHLEILTLNRRQFLRGTLPTEIGELTKMKYLDISSCPMMTGKLPSEIGRLTDLKYLNIGGCRFNGTIPEEIFELNKMEKLHLSMNSFTGTVPSSVEKMTNLKELLLSRTYVNGTIPGSIGGLLALENFEMYGNQLFGAIPESLGKCTNLKRIDLFNNKLTGSIPESLTSIRALQILHIKLNHLTGTISSGFGKLPNLSWFDVSTNHLHGTIPESFGHSKNLKDFRLGGGNMIHNPVPKSLCSNTNINGGLTKAYGCSGVICPLGTYSDPGHATHSDGCKQCPKGSTTIYLGSSRCTRLTDEDILTMFYDVMAASNPSPMQEKHWEFDREEPICSWNGVDCDENETIESIWFPLMELNADL